MNTTCSTSAVCCGRHADDEREKRVTHSSGLDVSRLSPSDAVAALRSYPRRFRALLASLDEDERPDDLVHRAGPDGLSAVDHTDHVARSLAILGEAMRQVLVQDEPTLLPAVADDPPGRWQTAAQPLSATQRSTS